MPRFKNVVVYRIDPAWIADLGAAEEQLGAHRFTPCGASEEKSAGWVEPRGDTAPTLPEGALAALGRPGGGGHGPLAESVGGQWLLEYMIESKALPASVVRRKLDERAAQIEAATGRAPGRKEKKELKEAIRHELLPMAFTRHARVAVWIDPHERRLTVDSANATRADEVVSALVEALAGFGVQALHTRMEPAAAMADWLASQEPPAGFSIDRECELRATDESKAVVRYAKHPLDIEEIRQHIAAGKRPTRLAMTWEDRVSFELTEGMQLRKLAFLEGVFDDGGAAAGGADGAGGDDGFDADAAIATGELGQLLPMLLEALGGEQVPGAVPAGAAAPSGAGADHAAPTSVAAAQEADAPF